MNLQDIIIFSLQQAFNVPGLRMVRVRTDYNTRNKRYGHNVCIPTSGNVNAERVIPTIIFRAPAIY
jgi:hypothetical protein